MQLRHGDAVGDLARLIRRLGFAELGIHAI
jgi:hypothetical protein